MKVPMKPKYMILIALVSLFLSACGFLFPSGNIPGEMGINFDNRRADFESNGKQIYYTAKNERGEYLSYNGGLASEGMMSGQLTCASCHGDGGQGGQHMMHMQWMDAPDIRFATLSNGGAGIRKMSMQMHMEKSTILRLFVRQLFWANIPMVKTLIEICPVGQYLMVI